MLVSPALHKNTEYVKVLKNSYLLEPDDTHLGQNPEELTGAGLSRRE